jgi:hypothetical protein
METDYRTIHFDLGVSGSYTGSNKVFGGTVNLLPSDSKVQSGKIYSLAVMISGSSFSGSIDLILSDELPTVGSVGNTYTSSFAGLKSIVSCVSLVTSDYRTVGAHSVAALSNLNIPFNSDTVYLTSLYQSTTSSVFQSGSVWATIGYELGSSR